MFRSNQAGRTRRATRKGNRPAYLLIAFGLVAGGTALAAQANAAVECTDKLDRYCDTVDDAINNTKPPCIVAVGTNCTGSHCTVAYDSNCDSCTVGLYSDCAIDPSPSPSAIDLACLLTPDCDD